VDNLLNKVNNT